MTTADTSKSLSIPYDFHRLLPFGFTKIQIEYDTLQYYQSFMGCKFTSKTNINIENNSNIFITRSKPSILSLIIDGFLGFLFGGLLHLIPAQFITVPVSLGSSSMHRKLGVVWAFLWLFSFIFFVIYGRQYLIIFKHKQNNNNNILQLLWKIFCCSNSKYCIKTSSQEHAQYIYKLITQNNDADDSINDSLHFSERNIKLKRRKIAWICLVILLILIINLIIVWRLIVKCNECGGCYDDGPPRSGCYP